MFDKLIDFVLNLKDEVIPVRIINEWEGGIHMRAGKFLKSTQPGLNFKIPFIDQFWRNSFKTLHVQTFIQIYSITLF